MAEDHKNEGFLKSIWHNLTNNAAHREANQSGSKTDSSKPEDEKKKE